MQRVEVLVSIASPTWSYSPGQVAEIDDEEAKRWVAAGIARWLKESPVETAMRATPETAAKRTGRGVGRG